jgi:hypothetical protein
LTGGIVANRADKPKSHHQPERNREQLYHGL